MNGRAVALFCLFLLCSTGAPAEDLPIPADQLGNIGVEFGTPQTVDLADDFEAPARIRVPPANDYAVVPIFGGTIKRLAASGGDTVRRGQPIAWISSPEFLQLQSDYIDALHRLELGQTRFANEKTLNEEGIVSTRRLSESRHELEEHRLEEQRLRQFLALAGLTGAEIDRLHDTLRLQPELLLRAPVDGVVLEAFGTAGRRVEPSEAVFHIADLGMLWLEVDVPYTRTGEIAVGATIFVREGENETDAKVISIGRRVDEDNQTVVVRAAIEDTGRLAPGQFVNAVLTRGRVGEFLSLPAGSIVRREDADYVFVRTPDGVQVREIEIVRRSQGRVIVGAGIAADDSIVIRGTAALKARWLGMGGGD